jgi:hypothetical protein
MRGFQSGFLQFLKEPAGFNALVLSHFARVRIVITDEQHVILRTERVEKGVHLFC